MTTFNGHKNWNHWNVSLWINNDKTLYQTGRLFRKQYKNLNAASEAMLDWLIDVDGKYTPDGAPFSKSSVRAALANI